MATAPRPHNALRFRARFAIASWVLASAFPGEGHVTDAMAFALAFVVPQPHFDDVRRFRLYLHRILGTLGPGNYRHDAKWVPNTLPYYDVNQAPPTFHSTYLRALSNLLDLWNRFPLGAADRFFRDWMGMSDAEIRRVLGPWPPPRRTPLPPPAPPRPAQGTQP